MPNLFSFSFSSSILFLLCLSNSTLSLISSYLLSPYASLYHITSTIWCTKSEFRPFFCSWMAEKVENSVIKMTKSATLSSENVSTTSLAFLCYIITMLYFGFPRGLFFEETKVIDFFDYYSCICDNHQISIQEKIRRLLWYCEMFTSKYIETMIRFARTNWAQIWKILWEK